MYKKMFFIVLLVAMVLSLSACGMLPQPSSNANAAGDTKSPVEHTLWVSGSGKVYLTPDLAYVYIGVQTNGESVGDALTASNEKAQAISNTLQELGVQAKDIQTSSFNVYPNQQFTPEGKPLPLTYNVDNTVFVTVRDLSILGKLLDAVVRSGANTINSINFDVTDRAKALSEARRLAVEDARKQADEIAAAAGVKVIGVSNLSVNIGGGPTPLYDAKGGGAAMAPAAQVPVAAGQLAITVDVSVTYQIQ